MILGTAIIYSELVQAIETCRLYQITKLTETNATN